MLYATERVDIPLDQLEAIGRKDLDRNLASLKEACAQFAPGKTLAECRERNGGQAPGQSVDAAREQLKELRAFVADHNLRRFPGPKKLRSTRRRLSAMEFRVHQHSRAVRKRFAFDLLHLSAGSQMAARRTEGLSSGKSVAPVYFGA